MHKPTSRERATCQRWHRTRRMNPGVRVVGVEQPSWIDTGNHERHEGQRLLDKAKAGYKQGKADCEAGLPRQADCPEYNAGYSYAEYMKEREKVA